MVLLKLKKSIIPIIIISALMTACIQDGAVFASKEKATVELKAPKNGAALNITNPRVRKWWVNYKKYSSAKYKKVRERAKPSPIKFSWEKKKRYTYKLSLSTGSDFENCRVFKTKKSGVKVYNLLRGQKYYWKVIGKKGKNVIRSKVRKFRTLSIARTIRVPRISNIRDIGGYKTSENSRTKQGLVYRSSNLDKIGKSGEKILVSELGIKTDLDLRSEDEGNAGEGSPALEKYINLRGSKYEDIFEDGEKRERFIKGVKVFAERDNYPMLIHCTYGRDRTGTLVFVLNGLLGVSKKDLYRDYELSFLTRKGSHRARKYIRSFDRMCKRMASYKDSSMPLSYNIECYLLDSGVTKREIKNIKRILG